MALTPGEARQIARELLVSLSDVIKQLKTFTVPEYYLLEYENNVVMLAQMTGEDLNGFKIPPEAIQQSLQEPQTVGAPTRGESFCEAHYLLAKIRSVLAHIDRAEIS